MSVYFCGGSCIEDVTTHLMSHLSLHPTLRTCSADTILRAIKELTLDNISKWVRTSRQYVLNIYSCNNAYADVFQNDFGWHRQLIPSLIFNCPFFLLSSTLRFSFAALCTTNFFRFWFFWRAFSYTLVVHKYHLRICSARCKVSCGPSLQGHSCLPWWPPSAWTTFELSLSRNNSLRSALACSVLCWQSSMRAVQGRGKHQTCRLACGVWGADWDRSSTGGSTFYFSGKVVIVPCGLLVKRRNVGSEEIEPLCLSTFSGMAIRHSNQVRSVQYTTVFCPIWF